MAWPNSYSRSVSRFLSSASAARFLAVSAVWLTTMAVIRNPGDGDVGLRIVGLQREGGLLKEIEEAESGHDGGGMVSSAVPTHGEKPGLPRAAYK